MGGVYDDWLWREWLRGIRGDEGSSIKFPIFLLLLVIMFATDNSNLTTAALFPIATGTHAVASYSLDHRVGTITQKDNRSYSRSFNREGPYPTNLRICVSLDRDRGIDLICSRSWTEC